MKMSKMRQVEYFRCWAGGGHGTWDTDFIEIPVDLHEDEIENAVKEAAAKIKWPNDEAPVFVGLYCDNGPEDENETPAKDEEMSKRKFYKSTFVVEVLSEEPLDGTQSLAALSAMTTDGDCSGKHNMTKQETLNAKQAAEELRKQGSDPEFFQIDEDGKDC